MLYYRQTKPIWRNWIGYYWIRYYWFRYSIKEAKEKCTRQIVVCKRQSHDYRRCHGHLSCGRCSVLRRNSYSRSCTCRWLEYPSQCCISRGAGPHVLLKSRKHHNAPQQQSRNQEWSVSTHNARKNQIPQGFMV